MSGRLGRFGWGPALVCAAAGITLFHVFGNATRGYIETASVFWWWGVQWFDPGSETQHGPLIAALAGWLFWRNLRNAGRGERRADGPEGTRSAARAMEAGEDSIPVRPTAVTPQSAVRFPHSPAFSAMIAALALHALGYAVQQTRLSIAALLLFTWGVLRLAGGERWGRAAAFPLLLLLFAVPVGFLEALGFHLRLGVIAVTEGLAKIAGIDVIRNGTQLFASDGGYQYDVAAACSGVRSFMALLALSLVIGYVQLRSWWRRGVVFLLAFPLTFAGNVVRIATIVFAGEWFGQAAGEWLHAWAGFVVFVIVLGGVMLAAGSLSRRETVEVATAPSRAAVRATVAQPKTPSLPWAATAGVVVAAVLTAVFTLRVDAWDVRAQAGVALDADGEPAPLPAFIATEWIGQAVEVTSIEREILPPDTGYARRNYVSVADRRHQVFLSIVLSGRDRTSIHRPELCLVGQGWTIGRRTRATLRHPDGGRFPATVLHLTREIVGRDGARRTVTAVFVYWFVGRDAVAATTTERLWRTALNRLRLEPDRWAYVVAQTLLVPGELDDVALARIQTVLDGTIPIFQPQRAEPARVSPE